MGCDLCKLKKNGKTGLNFVERGMRLIHMYQFFVDYSSSFHFSKIKGGDDWEEYNDKLIELETGGPKNADELDSTLTKISEFTETGGDEEDRGNDDVTSKHALLKQAVLLNNQSTMHRAAFSGSDEDSKSTRSQMPMKNLGEDALKVFQQQQLLLQQQQQHQQQQLMMQAQLQAQLQSLNQMPQAQEMSNDQKLKLLQHLQLQQHIQNQIQQQQQQLKLQQQMQQQQQQQQQNNFKNNQAPVQFQAQVPPLTNQQQQLILQNLQLQQLQQQFNQQLNLRNSQPGQTNNASNTNSLQQQLSLLQQNFGDLNLMNSQMKVI